MNLVLLLRRVCLEIYEWLEKKPSQVCLNFSLLSLARTIAIIKKVSKNKKIEDCKIIYQMFETNYKEFVYNTSYNKDVNKALEFCLELSEIIDEIYFNPEEDGEEDLSVLCSYYELMGGWYYLLMVICKQEEHYSAKVFTSEVILLPLHIVQNFIESEMTYESSLQKTDEVIGEHCLYVNEINRIYKDMELVQKEDNKEKIIERIKEYISVDIIKE